MGTALFLPSCTACKPCSARDTRNRYRWGSKNADFPYRRGWKVFLSCYVFLWLYKPEKIINTDFYLVKKHAIFCLSYRYKRNFTFVVLIYNNSRTYTSRNASRRYRALPLVSLQTTSQKKAHRRNRAALPQHFNQPPRHRPPAERRGMIMILYVVICCIVQHINTTNSIRQPSSRNIPPARTKRGSAGAAWSK